MHLYLGSGVCGTMKEKGKSTLSGSEGVGSIHGNESNIPTLEGSRVI